MVDKEKYIIKFKELYSQKNKKEISDDFAMEYFERLITLAQVIYKPISKQGYKKYIEQYEQRT